ncbi:MAG: efflux RND transporter periplasmic adaptor subunit [Wenzhouxiangellaceae bacterium]|nr:efflux RND transporter periplasmic adaptor subunit [Wenzhouxiangellaceae bacterium]
MNSSRWIVIAIAAAIIGFGSAWWIFSRDGDAADTAGESASGEREILYWVAPMDPNYRRDEPGKSPMGMELVPVYAGGEDGASDTPSIRIDPAVINNIGVQTAEVQSGTLARRVDTVGFVTPDADRVVHVHVRTEGWIERLEADNEGEPVTRGEVLFDIYSPALVSAQDEYLQARRIGQPALVNASRQRLFSLGMSADQVDRLERSGEVQQRFSVRSPQDGYVMELNVREGMFVQPGTTIMSLADLSEIWVDVDVFEQQIGWVAPGQRASMQLPFAPQRIWRGEVDYVYPTIRPESRTARVRLTFDNPDLQLKPNMYATVVIEVEPRDNVVHVPTQAVIRTGRQERVILALGEGRFRPAEVRTGLESDGRTEIVEGLSAGERIVVSSQFLIDSEASMDASLLRMLGDAPSSGQDHAGQDMGEIDHSAGDMEQGAPTPALRHEQEEGQMDHSAHDMSRMDHGGDAS